MLTFLCIHEEHSENILHQFQNKIKKSVWETYTMQTNITLASAGIFSLFENDST